MIIEITSSTQIIIFIIVPPFLLTAEFANLNIGLGLCFKRLVFMRIFIRAFLLPLSTEKASCLNDYIKYFALKQVPPDLSPK